MSWEKHFFVYKPQIGYVYEDIKKARADQRLNIEFSRVRGQWCEFSWRGNGSVMISWYATMSGVTLNHRRNRPQMLLGYGVSFEDYTSVKNPFELEAKIKAYNEHWISYGDFHRLDGPAQILETAESNQYLWYVDGNILHNRKNLDKETLLKYMAAKPALAMSYARIGVGLGYLQKEILQTISLTSTMIWTNS